MLRKRPIHHRQHPLSFPPRGVSTCRKSICLLTASSLIQIQKLLITAHNFHRRKGGIPPVHSPCAQLKVASLCCHKAVIKRFNNLPFTCFLYILAPTSIIVMCAAHLFLFLNCQNSLRSTPVTKRNKPVYLLHSS